MATTPPSAPGPAAGEAHIGTVGRLTGALFSPKATFADIARNPDWIAPVIVIILLSFVVTGIFGQRVGWRGLIEKKMADNKRVEQMAPDQKERLIEQQTKFRSDFRLRRYTHLHLWRRADWGGSFARGVQCDSGAQLNFKTSLGIVTYSWMPAVIQQILGILILFVKSPDTIDIEHLVASNAGAFLADDAPKWLMSICTSLDIFTFWTLFSGGIGICRGSPEENHYGQVSRHGDRTLGDLDPGQGWFGGRILLIHSGGWHFNLKFCRRIQAERGSAD